MVNQKSSLEIALDYYDLKLASHYRTLNQNVDVDVQEKRKEQLALEQEHLKIQRRHLEVLASTQAKLDAYREEGRLATSGTRSERRDSRKLLEVEAHHPTDALAEFMAVEGKPKPSPDYQAHHIVAGKGKISDTYRARVHMHIYGIRINDPDNGVWLPNKKENTPHWAAPKALAHKQYHTKHYEKEISKRVRSKSSEQSIRRELNFIEKLIVINKIPIQDEA